MNRAIEVAEMPVVKLSGEISQETVSEWRDSLEIFRIQLASDTVAAGFQAASCAVLVPCAVTVCFGFSLCNRRSSWKHWIGGASRQTTTCFGLVTHCGGQCYLRSVTSRHTHAHDNCIH